MPQDLFGIITDTDVPPRVFISPGRYVQGSGVIDRLGDWMVPMRVASVAVLASPRAQSGDALRASNAMTATGLKTRFVDFGGECTLDEVIEHVETLSRSRVDAVVAVGGGKTVDTGKAVAYRLNVPVVVVPTLASNDAPCSALSILYDSSGATVAAEFYPDSPALVVVDTAIISAAPSRFLAAGIGDVLATWYEAKVASDNPDGRSSIGGRPTIAALAISEACAKTLYQDGAAAMQAVQANRVNQALEDVVEANTLLSGLGFESGGLAAAHAVAQSCSSVPSIHQNHLHGEMVAFGLMVQLLLLEDHGEAESVADFLRTVGLPATLEQLSTGKNDRGAIEMIARGAVEFPTMANMPFTVTESHVISAISEVQDLGECRSCTRRRRVDTGCWAQSAIVANNGHRFSDRSVLARVRSQSNRAATARGLPDRGIRPPCFRLRFA